MRTRIVTESQGFWLPEPPTGWRFEPLTGRLEPTEAESAEAWFVTRYDAGLGRFVISGQGRTVVSISSPKVFDCCPRAPATRALWHCDQLLVVGGDELATRLSARIFVEPEQPCLERLAALEHAEEDDALWEVFIDELLTVGDPLAAYMVAAGPSRVRHDVGIERRERFGFVTSVRMPFDPEHDERFPFDSPLGRYLRELELRFVSSDHPLLQDHRAQGLLFSFGGTTYPCLRTLTLHLTAAPSVDLLAAAEAVRAQRPALEVLVKFPAH